MSRVLPGRLVGVLRLSFLLVVLVAGTGLVACDGDGDEGDSSSPAPTSTGATATGTAAATATAVSPTPGEPQVLRVNLTAEPPTIDPQRASDQVSLTVVRNLYSGLLRLDPEDRLTPDLAEAVPTVENGGISADGLTYTFRLREGLRWSDGTPLTAQAFVDGAKHLFAPGQDSPYVDFYRIIASEGPDGDANLALEEALAAGDEGAELSALQQAVVDGLRVEAPDDRTVVYHLNRPSAEFTLLASLWPLYPIRQDLLDAHGEQWTEAGTLVSNGPFALAGWEHGESMRLERNEHWHGPAVALDAVEFDMIQDTAIAFLAYQNDELDIALLGPTELVQVRGEEDLREQFRGYAQLRTIAIYPASDVPPFDDARVRRAFAGALDRTEYASAVLEGNALPAYSWIPPGMPGHDADVGRSFENATAASRDLLAEAGAADIEVSLLVPDASTAVTAGQWVKEQWERNLGVTVNLDVREVAAYLGAFQSGDFQLAFAGWGADYPDPGNWLPPFRSGSPLNFGRYSNPDFDALIDEAARELDFDERLRLYLEAQELLIEDAGVIPLNYPIRGSVVKPWVQGLEPSPREGVVPGDLFFDRVSIGQRR